MQVSQNIKTKRLMVVILKITLLSLFTIAALSELAKAVNRNKSVQDIHHSKEWQVQNNY
jgi:hypothetical protein